ncbi:NAD-dependent epimerase/dehydratase family protein [Nitrosopumilus ureiphilus]|uniref:NAD-dependent epimerase n=1 Tax=Nitrosopumilus ureiphilus TaxID=1470067 RepID=A0A7D5M2X4_9ARCH|nr:NAD-dependent epimerase/dehydratase family protein [Nitrosopumilus ureiphilus]QLH05754.1 NAD-dependent epimerase [Nitrosopumilus ureiphilus]
MNIAVTGGAGFIGSHIIEYLVNRGDSVTVIDNLYTGKIENLAAVIDQINFIQTDIRNIDSLRKILKNIDGVFHEAALASVQESFSKPNEYHDVNVNGTENILKLAKEFGFKVVYASSSSVYGNPINIPIKEDAQKIPINPYAQTKLDDEILAEKFSKLGVNVIGLRYFNVFGERQSENYAGVIKLFLERIQNKEPPIIYGDGSQIRDFIYVKDVVRANIMALESNVKHAFINIGTGKTISILELANQIIKASNLTLKPIHKKALEGDVHKSQADVTLAKKLLNWEYKVELKDWLSETVSDLIRIKSSE